MTAPAPAAPSAAAAPNPRIAELATRLRTALGDDAVIDDHLRLRTYECDGLAHYKVTPALVVLPEDATGIATVVKACAEAGVPFVARGSGTGRSGGALPHADGVLVVTSRMRRIVEIDRANQRSSSPASSTST
jgi:glycolate oxidase